MIKKIAVSLYVILFLTSLPIYAALEDRINTPNAVSAPRTNHLISYVVNAKSATLVQKNNSEFKLILNHVHDNVTYTRTGLNKKSELVETLNFINQWKKIKNRNVQADLTGVQINNKTFGHTQFYSTVLLKNPIYIADELDFDLVAIKPPIKMQSPRSDLKNVTLYLNGCHLSDCGE